MATGRPKVVSEPGFVATNREAAEIVGYSERRFREVACRPGFPEKGPKGWIRAELVAWAATKASRLQNLGPEGAEVQAEIFEVRARLLEIREALICGRLIPVREAVEIFVRGVERCAFQVKTAFETHSTMKADAAELEKAEEAYRRHCELMRSTVKAELAEGGQDEQPTT